jgi:uncharacterized damage-inducible protein DinB
MGDHLHEPRGTATDPKTALLDYLDFYRSVVAAKLDGLSDEQLDRSQFPSAWTPRQLVKHLVYMERRWLRWGFVAEQVSDPHGDSDADDRWQTGPDDTREALLAALTDGGARTRSIAERAALADLGAVGGRFTGDRTPPTLLWILLHVLQEYARHAGHLDIARESLDGAVGE